MVRALMPFSRILVYQGNAELAIALLGEAHELLPPVARGEEQGAQRAHIDYYEGRAHVARGALAAARACFERSLSWFPRSGASLSRDIVLAALGDLALAEGQDETAQALFEQSLTGLRATPFSSEWDLALLLVHLGLAALRGRQPEQARHYLEEALRRWHELGVLTGVGLALRGLGGVAAARGESERAGVLLGASSLWLRASDPFLAEAPGAARAAEQCLAEAQAHVDGASFRAGLAVGAAMTEAQALAAVRDILVARTADVN